MRSVMFFNPIHLVFRKIRSRRGLTQREVGKLLGVGQSTVSHWETDKTRPKKHEEEAFCKALNCQAEEIGEVLFELVARRFRFDPENGRRPANGLARRLAKLEELLEEHDKKVPPEKQRDLQARLINAQALHRDLQQLVWNVEDSMRAAVEGEEEEEKEEAPD